jgi:hypothetical protein
MANLKLQASRALLVIPSDNCPIPSPNLMATGVIGTVGASTIVDPSAEFVTTDASGNTIYTVNPGDVVYVYGTGEAAQIVQVINATTIALNAPIGVVGQAYKIYLQGPMSGYGNNDGCVLYIGVAGNIAVDTLAGDNVVFENVIGGSFFPVNLGKIYATGTDAENIIALW